jgi:nucleolar GTP-binding protein
VLEKVPTILSAQEILDSAFLRANKINVPDPDRYHRIRKTEEAQMDAIMEHVTATLHRYHKAFPTLENLPDYEKEVLDIVVGLDALKKALGHIDWAIETIRDVHREVRQAMARQRSIEGITAQKRRFSGRCSSIAYDVDRDLRFLRQARDAVRLLPTVHPEYSTVVIAGFPNVGKSSLLAKWTKADPEIAAYPFTTKAAQVGHFDAIGPDGPTKLQVVDTPGLLDRPDAERNEIERQAVAALRHAADCVLFLVDPTESSGYTMEEQEHLLAQVKREMAGVPVVEAETKADLKRSGSRRIAFSTHTGEGLDELRQAIIRALHMQEPELEIDPLEQWRHERRRKGLEPGLEEE